jgi:hypothetical protein
VRPLDDGASTQGGHARRRGAQDSAAGPFPLLMLGRSSADNLGCSLVAARGEGSEGEQNWTLGFMGANAGFVPPDSTCGRWMKMDGSRRADRPVRPRWENKILAQAHDAAYARCVLLYKKRPWADFVSGPNSIYEQ